LPRVEVDRSLQPVAVPVRIVNELLCHVRETATDASADAQGEECCGLIVGLAGERYRRLVRCRNDMTRRHLEDAVGYPLDGRAAFWMNEADYMRARDEAEAGGEQVTAVYHSHVGTGAYLSEMDQDYARHPLSPFPDADQIVVAVPDAEAAHLAIQLDDDGCALGLALFVWDQAGSRYRGHRVRPEAP
jgi:proteasome lid subunit RPN8/RPN11